MVNHKDLREHREALIDKFLRQVFFVSFVSFVVDLQLFYEISSRNRGSKHVHSNRIPCSVLVCQPHFFSRGAAESAEGGRLDFLRVSAPPREPVFPIFKHFVSSPLPRVLVCQPDFFSRGAAESAEGGRLDFLRVLRVLRGSA
jgi:hypothetical protein